MKRAGRHTTLRIRRERVALLRRHWRRYLVLAAMFAAFLAFSMVWSRPLVRAFLAGVYLTAFTALVGYSLMLDGSHLRMMGAEAEKWTSAELRKLRGWWSIDAVEFADRDIDHIAVGPSQILAIETKWSSNPVRISETKVDGLWCDGVAHAERAARRAENLLRSRGVEHPVTPVLMLWGRGVEEIPGGYRRLGRVRVLVGGQADEWRQRLQDPMQPPTTGGVRHEIESYVTRFEAATGKGPRHRWQSNG